MSRARPRGDEGEPQVVPLRDSARTRLLAGLAATQESAFFSLIMQAEGLRSADDDWQVIASAANFEAGFAELGRYAHAAGWGRWELVALDRGARRALVRVAKSWEGTFRRMLRVHYGAGLIAGKVAGLCERLFGVRCWPRQTSSIERGDPHDEFVVEPSTRSLAAELAALAEHHAVTPDLQHLLCDLRASAAERERIFAERERMIAELQRRLRLHAERERALVAEPFPIVKIGEGVLALSLTRSIDAEGQVRLCEMLRAMRCAWDTSVVIIDVSGVLGLTAETLNHCVQLLREAKAFGEQGLLAGLSPLREQVFRDRGVDLSGLRCFVSLGEALSASALA